MLVLKFMIFIKKLLPLLFICGLVLSSAYAFVSPVDSYNVEPPAPDNVIAVSDTGKTSTTFPIKKYKQDSYEDLNARYPMDAPQPANVKSGFEYDTRTGNYVMRSKVGETDISTPFTMTPEEYRNFSAKLDLQRYWMEKNSKAQVNNEDKFSKSDAKFSLGPADKVFGPGGLQIKTQGSAELVFGFKSNKINNPALTERMRKSNIFDFDEKIQLNVIGNVGDKLNFGLNYNTESSFDFDQKMVKLAFKGKEDDIIKSIEAGNVSMQLNSSLISGSTALFGVKTELQFGKLSVTALASQQESQTQTVSAKGGAQITHFDVDADAYDENRHFFLAHYFRDNYEKSMSQLPLVSSGVTIKRVEVWVTNKRGNYDQARNIVAFMDLGEADVIDNSHWTRNGTIKLPKNKVNTLYDEVTAMDGVRDVQQANNVLSSNLGVYGINGGEDYEKIESARRLDQSEYTLNPGLGFISLRNTLNPDEVLGVAYEYSYGGQVYQVGEFSTDNVAVPNALVVKLLKATAQSPQLALWDLMMKNVYNLGALEIQPDNFKLNIVYRNDSVGTDMQYLTEGNIKNELLLRVMNLDRLDSKNNLNRDGRFDYVEGYTALSSLGRIVFPVLEPFGKHLLDKIGNVGIAKKYVFQELYDSTLIVAQSYSEKKKFRLVGEYKGTSEATSEIRLNAMNIPRGSVTVTAGGVTLVENKDYTVDYTMGTVSIIDQALVQSRTKIDVKLENQSMFSMQRKSLVGTHLEYKFNKDFSLGGTIMHLSEMPLTTKVNTGSEPISNTIWGMNTAWRTESQWITNMLDELPFVNATKPSTIALNAEFAQLIPGHSKVISSAGLAYLDDFESTKTTIDIHYPFSWYLASTPYNPGANALFPEAAKSNDLEYGKNRALMSWYLVDPIFNSNVSATPQYLRTDEAQSNHLTRTVVEQEIFPNRMTPQGQTSRMTVLNLSYYPTERGPYNLDVAGMNADGTLANPKNRWGGIMRKLDANASDFETSNIEYIEFWMMDPFINDKTNTDKGGDLYFNLGDVSEDILKDGKKSFENGLPLDGDLSKTESTKWGVAPKIQSTVTAFDNAAGARKNQDVGLDGLATDNEFQFSTYKDYVAGISAKLSPDAKQRFQTDPFSPINDPAGDNYHFYRGNDYDDEKLDVLTRYKHYNGVEGNSPETTTNDIYGTSATSLPDQEDINQDNTLNEYEKYYQYRIRLNKGLMNIGNNHITDIVTANVKLRNGNTEPVKWYQFKIPVRQYDEKIGSIRNFKSIRFIRMFLTNFEKETHLRFATMDLVRGEWRNFTKPLYPVGTLPLSDGKLEIQAVNIEENSSKTPVNYVLPPGVTRETDPGQQQILQLNEQAMLLRVKDLSPGDARAVYKNTNYDMRQYKRLQMFVHAEKLMNDNTNLQDNQLSCFVRLGSDMVNNYYEYEIPLRLTPPGDYSGTNNAHRETVWYPENMFDFPFTALTNAKLKRNVDRQNNVTGVGNTIPYTINETDPAKLKNKITVVGNPSLSEVQTIMIGVRSVKGEVRGDVKSGEIWVNELRMSEFDESGGWAAMGNLAVGLSDIGNVNISGRTESAGFGGIESNVMNRRLDDLYQMNFSTALELGRFLPEKAKIQIPAYFSYSNETLSPKYNPLDQDVKLKDALASMDNKADRDSLKSITQSVVTTKSFNISGARVNIKSKTPQFYDPANVSFSYAFNETKQHSQDVEENLVKDQRGAIDYNFSFNPTPWEPFKNVKALSSPILKIVKDFNLNYLPTSLSMNTNMNRQYSQVKLRDLNADPSIIGTNQALDMTFSRDFMWNRRFDIAYDLTRSLKFSFQSAMNANIAEPYKTPEVNPDYYKEWRDSVWSNIRKLGTPYAYQQVFSASWVLPLNKIPVFDWVTSNASYNSTYDWNRMARVSGDSQLGNIATSMGAWQVDGTFNFETLYNKSKYLKDVNRRFATQPNSNKSKFQSKTYNQMVRLEKNKPITINHRLGSDKFIFKAADKLGRPMLLSYKPKNSGSLEITPQIDVDSVMLTLVSQDPNEQTASAKTVDFVTRMLMMVRRASFTYRESNSTVLPGFLPEPVFLGQQKYGGVGSQMNAPGYAFAFGFQDKNLLQRALDNGWLVNDTSIVNPATTAFTSDLDIKATLEPLPGFKIDVSAKRYTANNTTIQYMFDEMPTSFTGSYNITLVALSTAFKPMGTANQNYNSEVFNTFLANRKIIQNRLNKQYVGTRYPSSGFFKDIPSYAGKEFGTVVNVNTGYSENSADVLIPAFLAAYTGRDANSMSTNPFLSLLSVLPNWRISYDGLSRLPWVKNHFRLVSLTHAYTCRYSVGAYTSFSTWEGVGGDNSALGYVRDVQTNNPIMSSPYDISTVSLTEQFSPLIGVNVAMNNSMTGKVEFRKQRNLALNLSSTQLVEAASDEYVVGMGYVIKDFDVILKLKNDKQTTIKNDLKLSADLSYKDIKTLLRKIDSNLTQASSGNKLLTLKIIADYVFSSKLNIQLFYDRQMSSPLISSSFPVSSTNFGVSFKFMLTR